MSNSALTARRWGVIVAAALSGVLVFISMIIDPAPTADGKELIAGYSANEGAQGLHTNLIHYGFALFAPVAFAMVGMVRGRGAWIANVAALLAVIGLTTLPGLVLLDYMSVAAANVTDVETAFRISEEVEQLPGFVVLVAPAFLASMLAIPVAAIALWRARLVPWVVPVIAFVSTIAPNVAPGWQLGFGLMAVAMLALAWFLWRVPAAAWHGAVSATQ